jgi:mannose-1-phosphate guanylyltransferase
MSANLWNIVLAAGRGTRLASVTGGVPKQFWSPEGSGTLLEETLSRTAALAPPERTVIVVDQSHRRFVESLPGLGRFAHILYQPADKGTAAGVLLGLSRVVSLDRSAVVLLTPSDHAVGCSSTFLSGIRRAIREVLANNRAIVLFGVAPAHAAVDYGWILPERGRPAAGGFRRVAAFAEKPAPAVASRLLSDGAVWNTMVLTARASALLDRFERHVPEMTAVFLEAIDHGPEHGARYLEARYHAIPAADFSRDVIAAAEELSLHTWPVSMGWSDLGTPDRLASWLTDRPRAALADALGGCVERELRAS